MATFDRRELRMGRLVLTAFCLLFWLWVQHWPVGATIVTTLGALAALVAIHRAPESKHGMVGLVVAALSTFNLATFYSHIDSPGPIHARLSELPAGRQLLVSSVLWALGDSLFSLEPLLVAWMRRHARGLTYGMSLVVVVFFAVDSYFTGEGRPFKYPAFPPPQPARVFPAEEAHTHAAEHFMVDLRGERFTQRKPDGTTRIILNGASTMWGHRLDVADAPAAVMQRLLAERFPERRFEVICLAWPGKYQLNELVDSSVTVPHWQPDLVLSFNGFNEVWYGEDSDRFEAMPFWQQAQTAALSVPPSRALLYLHTHFGSHAWRAAILEKKDPPFGLRQPEPYEAPRYYDYLYSTARTLADHGIRYVHAFCPNDIERDADERATLAREMSESDVGGSFAGLFTEVRQRRRLSSRVMGLAMQRSYDVMASLTGATGQNAFMDTCHLSKTGVRAVMSDVVSHLGEWLEAPFPATPNPAPPKALAPLRFSAKAAAPFFTVGVGARVADELRASGEPGLLEASPRLALPAGHYRVHWYGTAESAGSVRADLVGSNGGASKQFAERKVQVTPGRDTQLLASVDAEFDTASADVEYRLYVDSAGTKIALRRVIFEQVWSE